MQEIFETLYKAHSRILGVLEIEKGEEKFFEKKSNDPLDDDVDPSVHGSFHGLGRHRAADHPRLPADRAQTADRGDRLHRHA